MPCGPRRPEAAPRELREFYDWDWQGAEAEFQRALELDPSYATAHQWYALQLRILEEVRGSAIQPLNISYVYAALREADAAFEWLEKAYERRSMPLTWIRVNPIFDPLRSDPRSDDLLRRIGFPES